MRADALAGGFADQVLQSQAVFRTLLDALSRPGTVHILPPAVRPPLPLKPAAGALLGALADADTPVWLDARLAAHDSVVAWIRFHTGARIVSHPAKAVFAVVADPEAMPLFSLFAQGSAEYPDRSATLIIEVERLSAPDPYLLAGPGVDGSVALGFEPQPPDFRRQLDANRALFPRGIDIVLTTPTQIAGLPRTTRIVGKGRA